MECLVATLSRLYIVKYVQSLLYNKGYVNPMNKLEQDINYGILLALRALCREDLHELALEIVKEHTSVEKREIVANNVGSNYDNEVVAWIKTGSL